MGKPSIFSNDYEQRMRRRKINLILLVLVIISGAFFGSRYYLNKNNISFFKVPNPLKTTNKKEQAGKETQNKETTPPVTKNQNTPKITSPQVQTPQYFSYKALDGKLFKVEYIITNGVKEITSLKGETNTIYFDISSDKKKIVFEDQSSGHIIMGDVDGRFIQISRDNYVTKSSGKTLTKEAIKTANPWFIWSTKPHFASNEKVIYISHLPYIKVNGDLYLWVVNLNGTGHTKIGSIGKDINSISYGEFDSNGRLIIKSGNLTYYFSPENYRLSR